MTAMRRALLPYLTFLIFFAAGCSTELPDEPEANKPPRTFLWLFPDSTLREGNSRQRIRWWGDDPDGIVRGYLFASGRLSAADGTLDTVTWHWVTTNDTLLAFPLLVRQDTFQVFVRAVDNTFVEPIDEHAPVRLSPFPYADRNSNGVPDAGEGLPSIIGAMDLDGATLGMPLLNQPPSLVFAQNPNDPTVGMEQPETTFTAATFAWIGSDPDGDATIASYEIALNSSADPTRWISLPGNVRMISLVVPRTRSDSAAGEVEADLYSGTYSTSRQMRGRIGHLQLDATNTFFIRARDVAGDVSPISQMPAAGRSWFVKKPRGKILIVSDYIASDSAAALAFYRGILPEVDARFSEFEVLNIGRGLGAQAKKESRVGRMVPPFIDPAFVSTLHLFDAVVWFTEQYPSLGVAQYPLFQYVRDVTHRGKVLFSTMFENSIDPRAALRDFAPIDSVSSVDLSTSRPLPAPGDTRIPTGFLVYSDSSEPGATYPTLQFGDPSRPTVPNISLFMRPIYKRADARYIYHIQKDTRIPLRYAYTSTLSDLRAVSQNQSSAWVCGANGTILSTNDLGVTWGSQEAGTTAGLNAVQFLDATSGWIAGDAGTILRTADGGDNWSDRSVLALQDGLALWFSSELNGVIAGTSGFLIRTSNGGATWTSPNSRTSKSFRSVHFADAVLGVAVGDSGLMIRTTDGGGTWSLLPPITGSRLNGVWFTSATTGVAVGTGGTVLRSTDGGATWALRPGLAGAELRSVWHDASGAWVSGANGALFTSADEGATWTPRSSGVSQHLNGVRFFSAGGNGIAVGTNGIVLRTANGGLLWEPTPEGVLNVGVIDGVGPDGKRSFAFMGLPLHLLLGDRAGMRSLLQRILVEDFGL